MGILERLMQALLRPSGLAIILAIAIAIILSNIPKKKRPLPPGPKSWPLVGNLFDMPAAEQASAYYTKLGKDYGPISSLSVFGTTLIIVNDLTVANEIMVKRAAKFSSRPVMPMLGEMIGASKTILLTPAGDRLNRLRKIPHAELGSLTAVLRWADDIDVEVRRYLLRTLEKPELFAAHLRRQATTVMLKVLYGYECDPHHNDPVIGMSEDFNEIVVRTGVPGAWLVDAIPALKYVPEWFPGAGFQRQARIWRQKILGLAEKPFLFTKREYAAGIAPRSVVSESLRAMQQGDNEISEDDVLWSATSNLGGGTDTTTGAMLMFYMIMILHQDVLIEAQKEIDTVVGSIRFIADSDRPNLPYTEALLKEVMRWQPILEMNPPHVATADDVVEGYLIPRGSLIMSNTCGIARDESIYKDPTSFNPARFLGDKPEMDPAEFIWGYGRRICPGRYLAYFTLWLEVSRTIQVFDIKPVPGKLPKQEYTWGIIRRPLPFEANIRIRSPEHERLVHSVYTEHPYPAHGSRL